MRIPAGVQIDFSNQVFTTSAACPVCPARESTHTDYEFNKNMLYCERVDCSGFAPQGGHPVCAAARVCACMFLNQLVPGKWIRVLNLVDTMKFSKCADVGFAAKATMDLTTLMDVIDRVDRRAVDVLKDALDKLETYDDIKTDEEPVKRSRLR